MMHQSSNKREVLVISLLLLAIVGVFAVVYWNADSQVKIRGITLNEQNEIAQGLHVLVFHNNIQLGYNLSFENTDLEGRQVTSSILANEDYNFEIKIPDKYDFPAKEYIGSIGLYENKFISTPSGKILSVLVVDDLDQVSNFVPNFATSPDLEPPPLVKTLEYIFSLNPITALAIIILITIAAILTGFWNRMKERIVASIDKMVFSPAIRYGLIKQVNLSKGQIIVDFNDGSTVKEKTQILIRGETVTKKGGKAVRPIVGIATVYGLLENNHYWALIDKVHEDAENDTKYRIAIDCDVEIPNKSPVQHINLSHLNIGEKGRIYRIEDNSVFINIGLENGLTDGDILEIVEPQIDRGTYLGDLCVARLVIDTCEKKFSKCSVLTSNSSVLRVDSLVRIQENSERRDS